MRDQEREDERVYQLLEGQHQREMENWERRKDNNSSRCQNWVEKLPRLISDQAMDPQYARRSYQRKLDVLKIGVEQLEKIEEEMAELGG